MNGDTLPVDSSALTAEWLTIQLRKEGVLSPDQTIRQSEAEQIGVGKGFLSDVFRFHLEGDGPETLIGKFQTGTPMREGAQQSGVYEREVAFYRDVAPNCPLKTPEVYFAGIDHEGTALLLLEDLGHQYAPDHLEGLAYDRTLIVLEALAQQHGWSTQGFLDQLDQNVFPDLYARFGVTERYPEVIQQGWQVYKENQRRPHSAEIDQFVSRIPLLAPHLANTLSEFQCLVHGDLRVDNLFFSENGEVTVVDHQFGVRSSGLYDVAYLVSQGMAREIRKNRDRELVEHYREALQQAGLPLSAEQAWQHYCAAVVFLVSFPLGAIRGWPLFGERARDLCLTLVERWIDTVEDLELTEKYSDT